MEPSCSSIFWISSVLQDIYYIIILRDEFEAEKQIYSEKNMNSKLKIMQYFRHWASKIYVFQMSNVLKWKISGSYSPSQTLSRFVTLLLQNLVWINEAFIRLLLITLIDQKIWCYVNFKQSDSTKFSFLLRGLRENIHKSRFFKNLFFLLQIDNKFIFQVILW